MSRQEVPRAGLLKALLLRVLPEDPADATRRPLPAQLKRELEKIERGTS